MDSSITVSSFSAELQCSKLLQVLRVILVGNAATFANRLVLPARVPSGKAIEHSRVLTLQLEEPD